MSGTRGKARRFVVDLGDVAVSEETARAIGDGIQRVVLDALSNHRRDGGRTYGIRFPKEWIGLIIRERLEALKQLEEVEKQIGEFAGHG